MAKSSKEITTSRPRSYVSKSKRNDSKYDSVGRHLISHVLGFQEDDEDFEESLLFLQSNLLYHTNMDVDSHAITESLQGIALKIEIHGNKSKADALLSLTKKFTQLLEKHEDIDLKWSLLSFLINLANHPARDNLSQNDSDDSISISCPEPLSVSADEEWLRELMERSFHQPDKDDTLSNWSDEDDMKYSIPQGLECEESSKQIPLDVTTSDDSEEEQTDVVMSRKSHLAQSWLVNTMIPRYWVCPKKSPTLLSEYAVMRECIWILISPKNSFVFTVKESNEVIAQPSFYLRHLSQESVNILIQPVALAATQLKTINSWIRKIENISVDQPGHGPLKSFAEGLNRWKGTFMAFLCDIEQTVISQEGHQTLLWLLTVLDTYFVDLETIYEILQKPEKDSNFRALELLGSLVLNVASPMMQKTRNTMIVLLQYALRFHLTSLQNILFSEYIFSSDETQFNRHLIEFGVRKVNTNDDEVGFIVDEDSPITKISGVSFLKAIQPQVAKACKLKYILCRLNKLEGRDDISVESAVLCALKKYENKVYDTDYIGEDEVENLISTNTSTDENSKMPSIDYPDAFLRKAYEVTEEDGKIQLPKCEVTNVLKTYQEPNDLGLENLITEILKPIVYERCKELGEKLFHVLTVDYQLQDVMEIFKRVVVMEAGDIMHSFYNYLFSLINDRQLIDESMLTNQMQDCVSVQYPKFASNFNVSFCKLQDLDDCDDQSLLFSKRALSQESYDKLLSTISINYQTSFPLSLVLNNSVIDQYNQLFRFGLVLKRVVCVLENLHFKDITTYGIDEELVVDTEENFPSDESPLEQRLHRLQLLRFWLLHFVRIIHDHLYTSVFMPFSRGFEEKLRNVDNFFHLIIEHEALLKDVGLQCLLTSTTAFFKILQQVFSVVEEVKKLWTGPLGKISSSKLLDLENRYSTGHRVTARFLTSVSQTLQYPHVSALAESLYMSIPA